MYGKDLVMKVVSKIVGLAGFLVILLSVYGRFHGAQTLSLNGQHFAASSVLLLGTAMLVIGLFLATLSGQEKK